MSEEEKSQNPQANEQGFVGSNPTPRTILLMGKLRVLSSSVVVTLSCCIVGCGKRNFKRRRKQSLKPFFYHCCRCVLRLKLYGCRRQSVPCDINEFERCFLGSVCVFVWCSGVCLRSVFVTVYA